MFALKKWTAALTAAAVLLTTAVSSFAATTTAASSLNDYSVEVESGKVHFVQNGERVGTYNAKNTDLTLSIGRTGNLLVSFPNANGSTSAVTLGKQRSVQVSGTMHSLTANSTLTGDVAVVVPSGSAVTGMTVNAPIEAHIYGKVGTLTVQAAADVVVERGAEVSTARLANANSLLTANGAVTTVQKNSKAQVKGNGVGKTTTLSASSVAASGKTIARSKSGLIIDSGGTPLLGSSNYKTTTSSSGLRNNSSSSSKTTSTNSGNLRLTASTIYADYRDDLNSLEDELQDAVRAYDRDNGKRVYGDAYWVDSPSKEVTRTGTYSFAFEDDGNDYGEARGKVRIVVDRDDDDDDDDDDRGSRTYYFEKDELEVGFDRSDRRDYEVQDVISEDEIEDYVTAYDKSTDKEIEGDYELTSKKSSTLGTSIGFRFRPDSSRYSVKTGSIKIKFDDD